MLHHAFVPTHPEPTSQRYITKPQTVRLSSHTSVWNFAGAALHINYTTHVSQPILNKRPKTHYKLQIRKNVHLTHPCFELCQSSSPCYTTHVSQPILNQRPNTHRKLQIRKCSSHTIPVSNFARAAPHVTPRT